MRDATFDILRRIRDIDWVCTIRLAGLRALAATIVWSAILLWATIQDGQPFSAALPLFIFGGILFVAIPLAVLCGVVSQAGVPFVGLLALPFMFFSMVGDPLVWVIHKIKPDWVGVEKFGLINRTFLFIFKPVPADVNEVVSGADQPMVIKGKKYEGI